MASGATRVPSGRPVLWDRQGLLGRVVQMVSRVVTVHRGRRGPLAPRGTEVTPANVDPLGPLALLVLLGLLALSVLLGEMALRAHWGLLARKATEATPARLVRKGLGGSPALLALLEPMDPEDPRVLAVLTAPLEPREMSVLPALEVYRESQDYLAQMGLWAHLAQQVRRVTRET